MKYWLTTHYPQLEDSSLRYPLRVWLQDGKESVGAKLSSDDYVLIYEFKGGRARWITAENGGRRKVPLLPGREGIIAIAKATGPIVQDRLFEKFEYSDGTTRWWCWHSPLTLLEENGYISKPDVNQVLDHGLKNRLRSCGRLSSGLKELTEKQYVTLVNLFRANAK